MNKTNYVIIVSLNEETIRRYSIEKKNVDRMTDNGKSLYGPHKIN